jgi:hypothetical protein
MATRELGIRWTLLPLSVMACVVLRCSDVKLLREIGGSSGPSSLGAPRFCRIGFAMAVMAWIVSMSGIVGPWRQDRRERRVLCLGAVVLGVYLELVGGEGLSLRLRVVCVGLCDGVGEVGGCS